MYDEIQIALMIALHLGGEFMVAWVQPRVHRARSVVLAKITIVVIGSLFILTMSGARWWQPLFPQQSVAILTLPVPMACVGRKEVKTNAFRQLD